MLLDGGADSSGASGKACGLLLVERVQSAGFVEYYLGAREGHLDGRGVVRCCRVRNPDQISSSSVAEAWPVIIDRSPTSPEDVRERMVSGVVARRVFIPGQELPGLAMSRSLGDVQAHNLGVSAEPSIHEGIPMASGSILIVGSDGIWDKVPALEAIALVAAEVAGGSVEFAAAALVSEARARWLLDGGDVDDASAVVVFLSR
eukprot:CAMPEP_0177395396 /NCGR_PEP_ID=MMETSP0368-20130122/56125_1 /TAXON_ID=447022 ORGANISM="Scrippsiella hangoei-like, Strain SHHI-4" /NCGR_SAMPLE_ID=MMETSP0368 /ASSEMBLY_ACC=CAM_ASM_000363 /LENGTH=202 /DNA_ID=CAMNT_0018861969 /DNA_START=67 /DNA_END=675 /DNA_ORIENTATION=-